MLRNLPMAVNVQRESVKEWGVKCWGQVEVARI